MRLTSSNTAGKRREACVGQVTGSIGWRDARGVAVRELGWENVGACLQAIPVIASKLAPTSNHRLQAGSLLLQNMYR
jgi:hypothetical protein